jgi:phosphohistidine swiveling domain-containing protein
LDVIDVPGTWGHPYASKSDLVLPHLYTYNDVAPVSDSIGGKAANLYKLQELGARVPKWAVIPQEVLLETSGLQHADGLAIATEKISSAQLPADLLQQILAHLAASETARFAVRSSAIDEDGSTHSFAGQFETFLNVSAADIPGCVEEIWRSVLAERVLAYRAEHHLPAQWGIGVIVQEMILPDVSGVAFGIDPVSGNTETKVVSSVYGFGEGLVSGALDADTFTITPGGIQTQLATKKHALYPAQGGGSTKIAVRPAEKQTQASLTEHQIREIEALLNRLNIHLGGPQDIEFAYHNDVLYLLQTRPVTTAHAHAAEYILWDNSNIIESYPGITTPLTFSFITKMYASVYRDFSALLGVSKKQLNDYQHVFENTLGLVRGRVYYNLLSWYKMLAMLPGYSLNATFMENMMGVKERFQLHEDYQMSRSTARFRLLWMVMKLIYLQINLPRERRKFSKHLNTVMQQYEQMNFDKMHLEKIVDHYLRFEQTLLNKWKAPLINDFFAMIWFGLLQKQTSRYKPDQPNIHNDLLCRSNDIISTQPIHQSMAIAEQILANEHAAGIFKTQSSPEILEALARDPELKAIKNLFDGYIKTFGERCVGELKLETESYAQNPALYVNVLKAYVEQQIVTSTGSGNLEETLRQDAELEIAVALRGKVLKKWLFNLTLKKARDLVSNRENLRFDRTRGFGMVRRMMCAMGKKLADARAIKAASDVFYLELEEIVSLKSGGAHDLAALVAARKKEFDSYRNQPPPQSRFYTYGKDFSDRFIYATDKLEPAEDELRGIGCCPGIVQGTVQVVDNPAETPSLSGNILVTTSTDPGWITLFPTASAIIVERGSLLSHSAIVSRELGIPCIVSVTGLLRTLKTGDRIEMDGSTGLIKILNHAQQA